MNASARPRCRMRVARVEEAIVESTGEPVCWLERLCPECAAMLDDDADRCWRCGAAAPTTT